MSFQQEKGDNSEPTNQDSMDRGPLRDSDTAIDNPGYGSNDDLQAAACTTPAMLQLFLHDNLELNESEMRLRENCRLFGLKFGTKTEGNANCFFEAVSTQLKSTRLKNAPNGEDIEEKTPEQLREDVVNHYWDIAENSDNQVSMEDIESWCTDMIQEGTFADTFAVFGTAQLLKRDIVIVTSSFHSSPQQNVSWIVGDSDFKGEPLLLGHYCKKFYQSLEPISETMNNEPKPSKQRVTEMRETAIKAFTCICSEDIRLDDKSIEQLEKGDHIIRPCNLKLCCGLSCGYTHLCFHHAILEADVTEIDHQDGDVKFKFIGFHESNVGKAKIVPYEETLNYKELDIFKSVYKHPKYKGEQVAKNISELRGKDIPYHAFLNNCEHVCRGCVTGKGKSIQVDTLDTCCAQSVFGCLPKFLRLFLAFFSTVPDDFYSYNNGWIIGIEIFALALYFYLLMGKLSNSRFQYKLKQICTKCHQISSRNFVFGLVFIIFSVIAIIVDSILQNRCVAISLSVIALLFWLISEICNVCLEHCRKTTTYCIRKYCTFKCCNNRCNSKCCTCCKCLKCCQSIMDCLDSKSHCIVNGCSSCCKC